MPEELNINPSAGSSPDAGSGSSDSGAQNNNSSANQGDLGGSNAGAPDAGWEAQEKQYKDQIKALNRRLVEARRQANSNAGYGASRSQGESDGEGEGGYDFGTAMKIAEADLRANLEDILALYPELPSKEVSRIRRNPWSFVGRDSYSSLNVQNALLDIEQYVSDSVAEIEAEASKNKVSNLPTQVRPNAPQTPEGQGEGDSKDDLYSMPLEELEKRVKEGLKKGK